MREVEGKISSGSSSSKKGRGVCVDGGRVRRKIQAKKRILQPQKKKRLKKNKPKRF